MPAPCRARLQPDAQLFPSWRRLRQLRDDRMILPETASSRTCPFPDRCRIREDPSLMLRLLRCRGINFQQRSDELRLALACNSALRGDAKLRYILGRARDTLLGLGGAIDVHESEVNLRFGTSTKLRQRL